MWLVILFGLLLVGVAAAGLRGLVVPAVGFLSLTGFFTCVLMAGLFGFKARRLAMEEHQRKTASSMLVIVAGMLNHEDDVTLQRIATQGGPAGDAAAMLLENRRNKQAGAHSGAPLRPNPSG